MKRVKRKQQERSGITQFVECGRCGGSGKVVSQAWIGSAVAAQRRKAGLTLREVAGRLAVSIGYLSDLEHGRRQWTDETWERVMEAIRELAAAGGEGKG